MVVVIQSIFIKNIMLTFDDEKTRFKSLLMDWQSSIWFGPEYTVEANMVYVMSAYGWIFLIEDFAAEVQLVFVSATVLFMFHWVGLKVSN